MRAIRQLNDSESDAQSKTLNTTMLDAKESESATPLDSVDSYLQLRARADDEPKPVDIKLLNAQVNAELNSTDHVQNLMMRKH